MFLKKVQYLRNNLLNSTVSTVNCTVSTVSTVPILGIKKNDTAILTQKMKFFCPLLPKTRSFNAIRDQI